MPERGILQTMEYQVPQFIEVEDKIVGPLTLKQFIYLAGTAGLLILFFFYLPIWLAVIFALPVGALGAALSFYKMNGKPFIQILEAAFNYYTGAKLFLWKHVEPKAPAQMAAPEKPKTAAAPRLTRGKLSDLAWSLDVEQETGTNERPS